MVKNDSGKSLMNVNVDSTTIDTPLKKNFLQPTRIIGDIAAGSMVLQTDCSQDLPSLSRGENRPSTNSLINRLST